MCLCACACACAYVCESVFFIIFIVWIDETKKKKKKKIFCKDVQSELNLIWRITLILCYAFMFYVYIIDMFRL